MALGRRWYRLPIDATALIVMPALAILFVFGAHETARIFPGSAMLLIFDAVVFVLIRRLLRPSVRTFEFDRV